MEYVNIMKILTIIYLIFPCFTLVTTHSLSDDLEDFPLDDNEPFSDISDSNSNNYHREVNNEDSSNQFNKESNNLEGGSSKTVEDRKRDIMKKVVTAAMLKPGARQRLAQVMPILRTMSGPQRLALAALVSAQVMASPESPALPAVDRSQNITSELMLPISMDIATMFRGLGREDMARSADYRPHHDVSTRGRPHYNNPNSFGPQSRRDSQIPTEILSPPPPPPSPPKNVNVRPQKSRHPHANSSPPLRRYNVEPTGQECQFFTQSLCLEDTNYPQNEILASIKKSANRDAYNSLLLDSKQDYKEIDPFGEHVERRQGESNIGENRMCATRVEMAQPKRARATSGAWKYIVNTGDYTQTLRLEMCMRPQTSCSYLADGLRSECLQVYNYHRLLTWDQHTGLTMDVFKVPTCCSCHVQGFIPSRPQQNVPPAFLEASPETNFIAPEISGPTTQKLPPQNQGGRLRLENSHSIPKRESNVVNMGVTRRPPLQGQGVIHRGPPLPIQHEQEIPPRYPPFHNNLRRTSYRNHTLPQPPPPQDNGGNNINNNNRYDNRPPKVQNEGPPLIMPNQRHPELPVDNLIISGAGVTETPLPPPITPSAPATTPSRRINYSYHPIIDFFKTATSSPIDQRVDKADWTPITDGPRLTNDE
ncbi:neurotrophin 1 [Lycorma delicatula]|uniref:neurotrophin 1 n=1 Tax=Lycorma delicatula TaxID=130591 RepID=UPI003F5185D9